MPRLVPLEERALLTTFTVNSTVDNASGTPMAGTLRWAVDQADLAGGNDVINFDPSVFGTPQTIALQQLLTPIELGGGAQSITIDGPGASLLTIDANNEGGAFKVDATVQATISGLTFTKASLGGDGAVDDLGTLTLSNCTFTANTISGVYVKGTASISDCTITGDNSFFGAGIFVKGGKATISGSTIDDNIGARGAGICNYSQGTTTVTDCTISGNSALGGGGGLYNAGQLTVTDCIISGDTGGGGGGLYDKSGTAYLSGSTISGGSGFIDGGNLDTQNGATLTLADCTVANGSAEIGGGLYNAGKATLADCTISDNIATGSSGGGQGGGVANGPLQSNAVLILSNSTLMGNTAKLGGGGLYNNGTATLTASTIAGNFANQAGSLLASDGGGVNNDGTVTLVACTVSGNTTTADGGGVYNGGLGANKATLNDTIVAGNTGVGTGASDIAISGNNGVPVVGSYNLIGPGGTGGLVNGTNGNIVLTSLTNLGLTSLGDFGGPTETMALLSTSAGIAAGSQPLEVDSQGHPLLADQRGMPFDKPAPDIGAYQSVTVPLVVAATGDNASAPPGKLDLRAAVNLADMESAATTITFDTTVFASAQSITLTAGQLELSNTGGLMTITGPSAGVSVSGDRASRVFQVDRSVKATISGLTITDGLTSKNQGGSYAGYGAGLLNRGTVSLTNCTISANFASYDGGGLDSVNGTINLSNCSISGNTASSGSGLLIDGPANLTDCTVNGNASGGLENAGPSVLTMTSCTIDGNSEFGLDNYGTVVMIACSVTGNSDFGLANYGNGSTNGSIALTDTIVAGNQLNGVPTDIGGTDPAGVTGSNNLVGTGGSGGLLAANNILNVAAPGLAVLGRYGGPTQTVALLPGSPAIGAGVAVTGVTTDQRGDPLDSPKPDIGAFQTGGFSITAVAGSTPQSAVPGAAFANPLAVSVTANRAGEPVAGGLVSFSAPTSGASASLSSTSATIDSGGVAQVDATANSTSGSYSVTATTAGAAAPVEFALTNLIQPHYSDLINQTVTYGTSSATFAGRLGYGRQAPQGEDVAVTLDGVTQQAVIDANGDFSTTFADVAGLSVSGSPYTITYSYAGDATFAPASATSILTVTQATPTIAWADPADIVYGTALSGTQLDATASVPGTFTYTPASGTVLKAGSGQTLSVSFAPTDSADFTTATATSSINVTRATPTIAWADPADIVYGTALSSAQLDATASSTLGSVSGTFTYSPAAGSVLKAGSGQILSVSFAPTDSADFTTATGTSTINVNKATPTISWSDPADIVYGTALSGTQLDATASVPGTFTYTPAAGVILNAGSGQALSVSFAPTDSTDFTTATETSTINVNKATPTISWSNPAEITFGTPLSATQLDATASVPGTFTYTPASGTVLKAGSGQTLSVSFAPTDSTDFTTATGTSTINVARATPAIAWADPADIVYGTALSGTQLDATASVPGTFTYTPASGTVLKAGSGQTLSVSFAPTDSADFTTATATSSINVTRATPTIAWADPADIVYGTALSSAQLDATASSTLGSVSGTFTYSPAAGSVLKAGSGQILSVSFAPTDSADFTTATGTSTINVNKATPTIAWSDPADIVYGTALSGTQLDATASVPGTFTYSPAAGVLLDGGNQTLSVSFVPQDATDYATIVGTATIDVAKATPTLNLTDPGGHFDGNAFPATVTISGSGGNTTAAATLDNVAPTLTYYAGTGTTGMVLGSAPPTAAGTYTVVASFPGTLDYASVQSKPVPFTIEPETATLALTSSVASPVFGQSVTFVAKVTAAVAGTPSGTVTFLLDGQTPLATVPLDGSGTAMLSTSNLSLGSHTITATYSGDPNFLAGPSGSASESVGKARAGIVLVPHPTFKKKKIVSVGLTAELEPVSPSGVTPVGGTVTFEVIKKSKKKTKVTTLGTAGVSGGNATITVKARNVLKKPITIVYSGDSEFSGGAATPPTLTQAGLKSLARPTLALSKPGLARIAAATPAGAGRR